MDLSFDLLFAILFNVYVIALIILLALDNRESSSTLAWIFIFILLPIAGPILYLFIGRNWRKLIWKETSAASLKEYHKKSLVSGASNNLSHQAKQLAQMIRRSSYSDVQHNNSAIVFTNGKEKFETLEKDLLKAKEFIHMEYYIWQEDATTDKIKAALIDRSKQGVKVRILIDRVGGWYLKQGYFKELRDAGGEVHSFFNFLSFRDIFKLNYRDHRKIINIDGKVGYIGGMNMGQEYADGGKHFDYWRDTHLRVEGDIVNSIQDYFALNWFNTTKEKLSPAKFYRKSINTEGVSMQLTGSGPDSKWGAVHQLYFSLFAMAEKSIYIQSAYFIPSPGIYEALVSAALRGVEVHIMVTGKVDKHLPYWAAFTYFEQLLLAGVKIYHYQKGYLHSKVVVIDSEITSVGTANMDVRSFKLNYEINAVIYDKSFAQDMMKIYHDDLRECTIFQNNDYLSLSHGAKLRNSLARLFTPLL